MATQETLQNLQYPKFVSDRQQQMLNTLFGTQAGGGLAGTQALSSMQFDPSQVQQYMDPYQQNVTQDALKEMDRQGAMAQNQLAGQAVGAGAFGGSRFGIQQAEQARNLQDIKSRRIFEDMSRNYQQAVGAMQAANTQRTQQAQGFANLGNVASGIGQRTGALGQAQQGAQAGDVQQLMGIGGMQQQLQQQGLNTGYQNQLNSMMEPYRRLSFGQQMLQGLAPMGGTTQQTVAPMPTTNPYVQAAGTMGTLYSGLGSLMGNK